MTGYRTMQSLQWQMVMLLVHGVLAQCKCFIATIQSPIDAAAEPKLKLIQKKIKQQKQRQHRIISRKTELNKFVPIQTRLFQIVKLQHDIFISLIQMYKKFGKSEIKKMLFILWKDHVKKPCYVTSFYAVSTLTVFSSFKWISILAPLKKIGRI